MSFDIPPRSISKSSIKQILLKEIENQKIANFKQYGFSQDIQSATGLDASFANEPLTSVI
jgi:hypothetical protein